MADATYDLRAGTPAGTNIIGKVGIDQTTPGVTNLVSVNGGASQTNDIKVTWDGEKLPDTTAGDLAKITALEAKFAALVDSQAPVVAGYKYQKTKLTFTAVGAYSQYDLVGALVELPNFATANGRGGRITELRITCSKKTCLPQFEVHFFKASTVTVAADNAAWDERFADEDNRAGFITMPTLVVTAGGAAAVDISRIQHDDYGQALAKDIKCASNATSIWVALKLINAPATAFDNAPGNSIGVHIGWEQS